MSNGGWALRQSIYAAIAAAASVKALIGDPACIYDDVAADASFPFVTLGDGQSRAWSTQSEDGAEHIITLHAWSRYEGQKECQQILEALQDTLHDASLSPSGHVLVNLRFISSGIIRDPDGATTHGVIRFRAVTEPAS